MEDMSLIINFSTYLLLHLELEELPGRAPPPNIILGAGVNLHIILGARLSGGLLFLYAHVRIQQSLRPPQAAQQNSDSDWSGYIWMLAPDWFRVIT